MKNSVNLPRDSKGRFLPRRVGSNRKRSLTFFSLIIALLALLLSLLFTSCTAWSSFNSMIRYEYKLNRQSTTASDVELKVTNTNN